MRLVHAGICNPQRPGRTIRAILGLTIYLGATMLQQFHESLRVGLNGRTPASQQLLFEFLLKLLRFTGRRRAPILPLTGTVNVVIRQPGNILIPAPVLSFFYT